MSETNGTAEKVQEATHKVEKELKELGRELRKRAESARHEVVKQLHKAAETIRKEARETTADKEMVERADALARGLEKAANYLNSHTVDQLSQEATKKVRDNPWRTVALVFIVGLMVGLFLRRD